MWMEIGAALLMGMMVIILFPRARQMLKESPKGSTADWMSFIIPIACVVGFVVLLMNLV
jgi:hypothetical protein